MPLLLLLGLGLGGFLGRRLFDRVVNVVVGSAVVALLALLLHQPAFLGGDPDLAGGGFVQVSVRIVVVVVWLLFGLLFVFIFVILLLLFVFFLGVHAAAKVDTAVEERVQLRVTHRGRLLRRRLRLLRNFLLPIPILLLGDVDLNAAIASV